MSDLIQKYITAAGGNKERGCELMARELMRGDPDNFKAGYTAGNAANAAIEAFTRTKGYFVRDEKSLIEKLEAWEEGRNDPAAAAALAEKLADAARALHKDASIMYDIAEMSDCPEEYENRADYLTSLAERIGA